MRSIVIGLTAFFFTFSAVILYKALQLPTQASTINVPITDLPLTNEPSADAPSSLQNNAHNRISETETVNSPAQSQVTDNSTPVIPPTAIASPQADTTPPIEKSSIPAPPPKAAPAELHSRVLTTLDGKAFRSGQDILREAAASKIEKLISEISVFPNSHILIEGHTDSVPTGHQRRNNMNLSVRRANAIAKILISRGIARERISVVGYGDSRPIDTNRTEEGRARNRRVEVKLMLKEGEH
ncbi:OmpA family protein [Nitrosomonas sp. JL21]|uniref:OmpA family protein n=1 Tax=Nitrosomonas sp. JL21 TaxID=153949 RepID=UPI001369C6EF|nr:OmpA family protein [Nitrosomonas sp. JL21]MBL8498909.1 OmpA family protein [Nitrosomonas sp.]MCC7091316.1 OmpA family protein [Nitrosomonas sp.]MXS76693.1 OmpA family protein [Nitrosomonas sp. JL21]